MTKRNNGRKRKARNRKPSQSAAKRGAEKRIRRAAQKNGSGNAAIRLAQGELTPEEQEQLEAATKQMEEVVMRVQEKFGGCTIKQVGPSKDGTSMMVSVEEHDLLIGFLGCTDIAILEPRPEAIPDAKMRHSLMLIGMDVPMAVLAAWTDQARHDAFNYASRLFLKEHPGKDMTQEQVDAIEVPELPLHLEPYVGTYDVSQLDIDEEKGVVTASVDLEAVPPAEEPTADVPAPPAEPVGVVDDTPDDAGDEAVLEKAVLETVAEQPLPPLLTAPRRYDDGSYKALMTDDEGGKVHVVIVDNPKSQEPYSLHAYDDMDTARRNHPDAYVPELVVTGQEG